MPHRAAVIMLTVVTATLPDRAPAGAPAATLPAAEQQRIRRLIRQLDSNSYERRRAARDELLRAPKAALPILKAAAKKAHASAQVGPRLKEIISHVQAAGEPVCRLADIALTAADLKALGLTRVPGAKPPGWARPFHGSWFAGKAREIIALRSAASGEVVHLGLVLYAHCRQAEAGLSRYRSMCSAGFPYTAWPGTGDRAWGGNVVKENVIIYASRAGRAHASPVLSASVKRIDAVLNTPPHVLAARAADAKRWFKIVGKGWPGRKRDTQRQAEVRKFLQSNPAPPWRISALQWLVRYNLQKLDRLQDLAKFSGQLADEFGPRTGASWPPDHIKQIQKAARRVAEIDAALARLKGRPESAPLLLAKADIAAKPVWDRAAAFRIYLEVDERFPKSEHARAALRRAAAIAGNVDADLLSECAARLLAHHASQNDFGELAIGLALLLQNKGRHDPAVGLIRACLKRPGGRQALEPKLIRVGVGIHANPRSFACLAVLYAKADAAAWKQFAQAIAAAHPTDTALRKCLAAAEARIRTAAPPGAETRPR